LKVLVTGAGGFLGRHVVARLTGRGHEVRAVLRPAAARPEPQKGVVVVRADLRAQPDLSPLFDGVDAVVHLAAATEGDEDTQFASSVVGTERLLDAMARTTAKRLVLVSSLVVYDWRRARGTMDEKTPLAGDIYRMGAYDIAKYWQERVVSRRAVEQGLELTVLRPGFIWGPGRAEIAGMGRVMGRAYLLIGPSTRLPLTHVENCADAIAAATESRAAIGRVFNVVDSDDVRVWRYAREHSRGTGRRGFPVPVPYALGLGVAHLAAFTSRFFFGRKGKLPSLLTPRRFEAQFKPLRYSNRGLLDVLGWTPPLSFDACLGRTYGAR
jgi:nucleoside-diphosphate-sugar epimerase